MRRPTMLLNPLPHPSPTPPPFSSQQLGLKKGSVLTKPLWSSGPDNWVWRFPKQFVYSLLGLWPALRVSLTAPPVSAQPSSLTLPPWKNGSHSRTRPSLWTRTLQPHPAMQGQQKQESPKYRDFQKTPLRNPRQAGAPRPLILSPLFCQPSPSFAQH